MNGEKSVKLWMAPLHGVTVSRFRTLFFRHFGGIDAVIAPFLPVIDAPTFSARQWKDILPQANENHKIMPQLMGNNPDQFVNTIRLLSALDYHDVNWNIGCPMPQIVRKMRGCGLMPHPDEVERVVETVCSKTDVKFSIKMRLGLHSADEGMALLERLNGYPLDFIVIHPRLGVQQYDGVPDLNAFDAMLNITRHEVVYSGDIWTKIDFEALQKRFPMIHQWMLGRGLLRNPFLAEQILGGDDEADFSRRFVDFYLDLLQCWSSNSLTEKGMLNSLKELWHYFSVFVKLDDSELISLLRVDRLNEFERRSKQIVFDFNTLNNR